MSTNIIFQTGLYNGVSMLLNNASQIAILQNSHLTNNSKAQQLNQQQLTEILDCCLASRTSFAILTETLGKILHEYNHQPNHNWLVTTEELLEFSTVLNTMIGSLTTSISNIETQASS